MIRLRSFTKNKIIEITKNDSMTEHIICDPDGTIKIEIPISINQSKISND